MFVSRHIAGASSLRPHNVLKEVTLNTVPCQLLAVQSVQHIVAFLVDKVVTIYALLAYTIRFSGRDLRLPIFPLIDRNYLRTH